jgi:hypothetical protein
MSDDVPWHGGIAADIRRLLEIERCATGLILTAHSAVGEREVVPQWWDALVKAIGEDESW